MLEEIKEVNWNEDILKKYYVKSIQSISESNLDSVVYIKFNNGIELNSNLHRFEISNLLLSVKSDNRDEKIKQVIND